MKRTFIVVVIYIVLCSVFISAQPIVKYMYPLPLDSILAYAIVIPETNMIRGIEVDSCFYVDIPFLSQSMHPDSEIGRFCIIDSSGGDIFPIHFELHLGRYIVPETTVCETSGTYCPCPVIISLSRNNSPTLSLGHCWTQNYIYSLDSCVYDSIGEDTITYEGRLVYSLIHSCNNIHLEKVSSFRWEIWFGCWSIPVAGLRFPNFPNYGYPADFDICKFCNDSGECSDWITGNNQNVIFSPMQWMHPPFYLIEWASVPFTTLPPEFFIDVACPCDVECSSFPTVYSRLYLALDSTSAWMTISWDEEADTFFYGDSGTFWLKPTRKHIGWRRFGVETDRLHLPAPFIGNVRVCLHEATNAPVIAFGEPTHLHPPREMCYDEWIYNDPNKDSTYTVYYMLPSPPVPVCTTYFVMNDISEERRVQHNIGLDVNNAFDDINEMYYSLPSNGNGIIAIYNIMGRVVLKREVSGSGVIKVEVDELSSGIYFAVIKSADYDKIVRRVLVVR